MTEFCVLWRRLALLPLRCLRERAVTKSDDSAEEEEAEDEEEGLLRLRRLRLVVLLLAFLLVLRVVLLVPTAISSPNCVVDSPTSLRSKFKLNFDGLMQERRQKKRKVGQMKSLGVFVSGVGGMGNGGNKQKYTVGWW